MRSASPAALADESGPSLMTRVAAVVLVLALAGVAAYAVFSGPTTVTVPTGAGATKAPPAKVAPADEGRTHEPREGTGGD